MKIVAMIARVHFVVDDEAVSKASKPTNKPTDRQTFIQIIGRSE